MLFDNKKENVNERILYKTKPNMLLGCKKAIFGVIILAIILMISPRIIQFIGEMQVYLISYIKISLTRYTAIAFFVIVLIVVIYIIWQLVGWYSMEYILTDSRIIIKSGVLSTKKNYMPYSTIQDLNSSQSILAKLINVGSISVFSAYDNNQLELKNISDPSKVEEIIFSRMVGPRNNQYSQPSRFEHQPPRNNHDFQNYDNNDNYYDSDYYDEFEPITPITHEKNSYHRNDYEYYPENIVDDNPRHRYEYEPYNHGFNTSKKVNADHSDDRYHNPQNSFEDMEYSQGSYYNQVREEYSNNNDDYYQNNESENYYNEWEEESLENEPVHEDDNSSQKVIQRHFDKFKK